MKNKTEVSDFYCTKCGKRGLSVLRKGGQFREPGHLKNLYCPHCKEEHNCVEIRPINKYTVNMFRLEYENGNFDEEGNRKVPYIQFLKGVDNYE